MNNGFGVKASYTGVLDVWCHLRFGSRMIQNTALPRVIVKYVLLRGEIWWQMMMNVDLEDVSLATGTSVPSYN